ncbi:MAG TPA: MFS transporter [Arthrobacter sp.]|nr:MFS transporter [Arthrobacter sp.]
METTHLTATRTNPVPGQTRATLGAAALGNFVITLDAVVVNVALPGIRNDVGGGMTGLQWVVDGYTLMFAGLLLTAGAVSDRLGARRSFGFGLGLFVIASLACGLAPNLGALVAARFIQGAAAAIMMPTTMALIGQTFRDPKQRARAIGAWAAAGAIAASSGPVVGGLLNLLSWRLIFLVNLPVGVIGLLLLARVRRSPQRDVPFDWAGQTTAVLAMGGITYATIEAGPSGLAAPHVLLAFAVGFLSLAAFVITQRRGRHPMVPRVLATSRTMAVSAGIGFAFMVGFYGLPFVMSLYLQQHRGFSSLATGIAFLPMMAIGAFVTPIIAKIIGRFGARRLATTGLLIMAAGLAAVALAPEQAPVWVLSAAMVLVGLSAPLIMPPTTAILLDHVPGQLSGTASGVFNTSRQTGGALAVAVFGALLARPEPHQGVLVSLSLAAVVALAAAAASRLLPRT